MHDAMADGVLLVEDNPNIRNLISTLLEGAGFEAQQAEDGIDGLVKLREKLPKVIISDVRMPRMSGIEFLSVVRRRFPFIPVILISASCRLEVPVEAKPDRWITKDSQCLQAILQAVHDLVRKTPDRPYHRQVISAPVRTRPDGAGYFVLTCTDCLRLFQVINKPEDKTVERTAACFHCAARVPFLIESLEPE